MSVTARYPFVLAVHFTAEQQAWLDRLKADGGYKTHAELVRSIIENLRKDDLAEHEVAA